MLKIPADACRDFDIWVVDIISCDGCRSGS